MKDPNDENVQNIFISHLCHANEVRTLVAAQHNAQFDNTIARIAANLGPIAVVQGQRLSHQPINSMGSSSHQSNASCLDNIKRQLRVLITGIHTNNFGFNSCVATNNNNDNNDDILTSSVQR